ncbi:hypothetical protein [Massilia consociata]|uniref:DUF697 domain-containing protein n=1 Tax=Massilia consociata TaxID=760117 RepID=A0ABV6FKQ2_9BURK
MMHNETCRCMRCQGETFEMLSFPPPAPFGEVEEMELAMELLSVASEAEMDQFIGKVFRKAWRGVRKVGSAMVKPLGSALKGVAKAALPFVGGALGSFIPIPGVGTMIGRMAGNALASALEVEVESELAGAGRDEQELRMALRFVRIAGNAAERAARAAPGQGPGDVVRDALEGALTTHLRTLPQPVIGRWRQRRQALRGR